MQDHVGYRTQKRLSQKKQKKRGWRWIVALVVIVVLFVILGAVIKVYPFDKAWNKSYRGITWVGRQIKSAWPFKERKAPLWQVDPRGQEDG